MNSLLNLASVFLIKNSEMKFYPNIIIIKSTNPCHQKVRRKSQLSSEFCLIRSPRHPCPNPTSAFRPLSRTVSRFLRRCSRESNFWSIVSPRTWIRTFDIKCPTSVLKEWSGIEITRACLVKMEMGFWLTILSWISEGPQLFLMGRHIWL